MPSDKQQFKIPVLTPKAIAGFISSCAVILGLLAGAVAMVFRPLDQRVTALEQEVDTNENGIKTVSSQVDETRREILAQIIKTDILTAIDRDFKVGAKREYIYANYTEFKRLNGGMDDYIEQRLREYNDSLGVNL